MESNWVTVRAGFTVDGRSVKVQRNTVTGEYRTVAR